MIAPAPKPQSLADHIVQKLEMILPIKRPLPLHEPCLSGNEQKYTSECIETGWVSSVGKFVDRFENDLSAYTGAKKTVVTVNGTAALHVACHLIGAKAGDEILCPTITFAATANALSYTGATPHFVDCENETLGVDPQKLRAYLNDITTTKNNQLINKKTGNKIAALIVTHIFGNPAKIEELLNIANDFNIPLIEDAAEAMGTKYKEKHLGTFGTFGILSFNGNKIITTGGGGALLTNDENLGARAKHITTTAKKPHAWEYAHDEVGFNYRMPNVNAAMGCAQLEQLENFIANKHQLAASYEKAFVDLPDIQILREPPHTRANAWLNAIIVPAHEQQNILTATHAAGFLTRPLWQALHTLPHFKNAPRMDLSTAETMAQRIINLPSSVGLVS